MLIHTVRRPWEKKQTYSKKSAEPWYQTREWKMIRSNHLNGTTVIDGFPLSNQYCVMCYKESGKLAPVHTVDHITPIKEGGNKRGPLQSLCKSHNASKTATDGNRQRKALKE